MILFQYSLNTMHGQPRGTIIQCMKYMPYNNRALSINMSLLLEYSWQSIACRECIPRGIYIGTIAAHACLPWHRGCKYRLIVRGDRISRMAYGMIAAVYHLKIEIFSARFSHSDISPFMKAAHKLCDAIWRQERGDAINLANINKHRLIAS